MKKKKWIQRHVEDSYVKLAQREGYRSRAAYKLLEIQEKDHILKKGMTIVDLGAAPGGWLEVGVKYVGQEGRIIGVDRLSFPPMEGVECILGDFTEAGVLENILKSIDNHKVDLVMSDMAPNMSGIATVDIPKAFHLAELALDFAGQTLEKGGIFLVKLFQGEGFTEFIDQVRQQFCEVKIRKPKASRIHSKEVYLLAKGFLNVNPHN